MAHVMETDGDRVSELMDQLNREIEKRQRLESEALILKSLLRSAISPSRASAVQQLKQIGVITDTLVFQSLMMSYMRTHAEDEDDGGEEADNSLTEDAKFLQTVRPFLSRGSKILVLISGFPASILLSLAFLSSDFLSLSHDVDSGCDSPTDSSLPAAAAREPKGCVIGKTSAADARIFMRDFRFLISNGVLRINVFSDSAILSNGYAKGGPYDLIVVPEIGWSERLKSQLKTNGLVITPYDLTSKVQKTASGFLQSV